MTRAWDGLLGKADAERHETKAGELLNIFWECCGFQAEHRKSTVQALSQAIYNDII